MGVHKLGILAAAWIGLAVWGLSALAVRSSTPGQASAAPAIWPSNTSLRRELGKATLIVVAHPRCSCTRATLAELDQLMTRLQGRVTAYVVFAQIPGVTGVSGVEQDLLASALRIPGVTVVRDVQTQQTFRVNTSGQTFLYDGDGNLIFAGGITPERGCEGLNDGVDAIERLLAAAPDAVHTTPVYGCPLSNSGANSPR